MCVSGKNSSFLRIFRKITYTSPRAPESCLDITSIIPRHVSAPPGRLRRPTDRSRRLSSSSGASAAPGADSLQLPRMSPNPWIFKDFLKIAKNHHFQLKNKSCQIDSPPILMHPGHAHASGNGSPWPPTRSAPRSRGPRAHGGVTYTFMVHAWRTNKTPKIIKNL